MAEFSSAQRYSVGAPVPIGASPPPYGAPYPPQPQPMVVNAGITAGVTVPAMGSAIVVNQVAPAMSVVAHTSSPFATVCPFCKSQITTTAIQTFNCGTCLLCYCTGLCLFCCIQLCRGKDICCYDAIHKCPACGQTVAVYNSC